MNPFIHLNLRIPSKLLAHFADVEDYFLDIKRSAILILHYWISGGDAANSLNNFLEFGTITTANIVNAGLIRFRRNCQQSYQVGDENEITGDSAISPKN